MERPPYPSRWLAPALLLLAVSCAAAPAWLASRVQPPGNDLGLHGMLVDGAAQTLRDHGWTAFQDPWFEHPSGGYAVFHAYPHLPHQLMAGVCAVTGADPWTVLGAGCFLLVLVLPLAVYGGGRLLGLTPVTAAFAAVVAATLRSADPYGHGTLSYGFESLGMVGQLWGMALAAVVFPAWVTACAENDDAAAARTVRLVLAAAGVSLVLRTHFPTAWVMALAAGVYVVASGPLAGLAARLARYALVGGLAVVLSLGFLAGFVRDLDAMVIVDLEHDWKQRSIGALAVLGRLVRGEYLDGLARAPWTPALLAAAGWIVGRWVRERRAHPGSGLLAAAVAALLLLFGRHTWGDWIDGLPVVGRFHDHRYLLGLHLMAPWLIAAGLAGLWPALKGTAGRIRLPVAVGAVGLAVVVHGMAAWIDLDSWRRSSAGFQQLEAETEPLVAAAVTEPGRLALAVPDHARGGTTLLWWLRAQGADTAAQPMHHYAMARDFELFWGAWLTGESAMRDRPLVLDDLAPLGVSRLVVPARSATDPLGHPWPAGLERAEAGPWALLQRTDRDPLRDDLALVRSDLRVRGEQLRLRGLTLAWFLLDMHRGRQVPTLDVAPAPPPDDSWYLREVSLDAEDANQLLGLPAASADELGSIERTAAGARPGERVVQVDVASEGVWLRQVRSWHPGWRAAIDGDEVPVYLLVPGHLGVRLPPGRHEVALWWHVPGWRGVWAGVNTALYLVGGGWLVGRWWRRRRQAG